MPKFKIDPAPTFKAPVPIPIAGGDPAMVEMEFKHRDKDELDAFIKSRTSKQDADSVMEMVVGWDFEDEFSEANVKRLVKKRIGAPLAIFTTYIDELVKARTKN